MTASTNPDVRDALLELAATLNHAVALIDQYGDVLEPFDDDKRAAHVRRLLELGRIVVDRAAMICVTPDPDDLRFTLTGDEWDLLYCACSALEVSAKPYEMVDELFPGAIRALVEEATPDTSGWN